MAKIHIERLQRRYEGVQISGNNYAEIVKNILDTNIGNVQRNMARQNKSKWETLGKKFRTREIRLVLPDAEDVIPKRAIHMLKVAKDGEFIRESLRDNLTKDLRKTLLDFDDEKYITRRGAKAGHINPRLVNDFENKITDTFKNYTRRDKTLGMPKNIHTIAVTETRTAINNVKQSYTQKIIENNPDIVVKKKWIHNPSLSKKPRRGHKQTAERGAIAFNEFFKVPLWREVRGKLVKLGYTMMRHPHDPTASAEQVIGCNCDYDIIVSKRKVA